MTFKLIRWAIEHKPAVLQHVSAVTNFQHLLHVCSPAYFCARLYAVMHSQSTGQNFCQRHLLISADRAVLLINRHPSKLFGIEYAHHRQDALPVCVEGCHRVGVAVEKSHRPGTAVHRRNADVKTAG